jgi:hypothetical protein
MVSVLNVPSVKISHLIPYLGGLVAAALPSTPILLTVPLHIYEELVEAMAEKERRLKNYMRGTWSHLYHFSHSSISHFKLLAPPSVPLDMYQQLQAVYKTRGERIEEQMHRLGLYEELVTEAKKIQENLEARIKCLEYHDTGMFPFK